MRKSRGSGRKTTGPDPASAGPPQPALPASRARFPWLAAVLGAVVVLGGLGLWRMQRPAETRPSKDAPATPAAKYVENGVCLGCHETQAKEWRDSHHAKAMEKPTEKTVLGDFNNTSFSHGDDNARFFKRGDRFVVNIEGPDGKRADFEVKYTFGVDPLQQYLLALPGGRLQPLTIAWDVKKRRWFHLYPKEKAPPGDVLHWTGRYQTANTMCLVCHTTDYEKRYDAVNDTFASRWAEPNVSCQSCHGPGDGHVQWETSQRGAGTPAILPAGQPHGLTVDIKGADARQRTEFCAPCHQRRSELTSSPAPGQPLLDNYLPSLLVQPLYHADGQQLEEVYVDGSFRQSLMFQRGVTCTNCHNAHTGKLKSQGNEVCLQCHKADPNPSFPRAAGNFDSPAHHFHKQGSPGAQCVTCHMPSTTYMQVQARPDHSIRVPRPDLSVKIGTPNACTSCHTDRKAAWAAAAVAKWYGPVRKQGKHFGEAFAAARIDPAAANAGLVPILTAPDTPPIVRATALELLRPDPATGASERIRAARDADAELRVAAASSLENLGEQDRIQNLVPLLTDPVRAVRITAARTLSFLPPDQLGPARAAFDTALAEYIATQNTALDMPGAHLNLAVVYGNTGKNDLAEQHYLKALVIDPDFTPARANLAHLYNSTSRNADAERVLAEGLKRVPGIGELQYSLGLILAENQARIGEAADALGKAARLLPDRAGVHYNHGLALQMLGRRKEAEAALLTAQRLDPGDQNTPYALAIFYAQGNQKVQALEWAEKLNALRPNDPQVASLIARLRAQR